jgi:drug/metabolite transporter (DMT)-like permease
MDVRAESEAGRVDTVRVDDVHAVSGEGGIAISHISEGGRASTRSIVLLIASSLMFSTGGLFVRSLEHPHAWTTVFWRSVSAGVSLVGLIAWRERSHAVRAVRTMGLPGYTVAAAFSASSIGMVVALSRTSVAIVLVIFSLSPLVAAIMAWVLIGERVRSYTWVAIAVTVIGVGYMVSGSRSGTSMTGALIALVIPVAFGYGTVTIRQHSEISMIPAMLLSTVLSALIALPFARPFDVNRHDFILLMLFGFLQLGVGLAVFSLGAGGAPATDVALLAMLEPIMGPIWVWKFGNEYPGVAALIGGSIVFVALAVHTVYAASRATPIPPRSQHEGPLGAG